MDAPAETGAWARARQSVMVAIVQTAKGLFLERGFDAVTVEEIATEVGISRRSLFRYFGTKEDILLGGLAQQGYVILAALQARPVDEDPWQALIHALMDVAELQQLTQEGMYEDACLYLATPTLRNCILAKHAEWQQLLAPELARRIGGDDPASNELRGNAIAAGVLACLHAATDSWVKRGGDGELAELVLEAAAALRGAERT